MTLPTGIPWSSNDSPTPRAIEIWEDDGGSTLKVQLMELDWRVQYDGPINSQVPKLSVPVVGPKTRAEGKYARLTTGGHSTRER